MRRRSARVGQASARTRSWAAHCRPGHRCAAAPRRPRLLAASRPRRGSARGRPSGPFRPSGRCSRPGSTARELADVRIARACGHWRRRVTHLLDLHGAEPVVLAVNVKVIISWRHLGVCADSRLCLGCCICVYACLAGASVLQVRQAVKAMQNKIPRSGVYRRDMQQRAQQDRECGQIHARDDMRWH